MTPEDWEKIQRERGLTLRDLAKAVGITTNQLRSYMNGGHLTPKKVRLAVSAVAMGLQPYGTEPVKVGKDI